MPNISVWHSVHDTKYNENRAAISPAAFIQSIKDGVYRTAVEKIRAETDKAVRNELKKKLLAVTPSGLFRERNMHGLVEHSGFICIDFDNLDNDLQSIKNRLIADKYVYSAFVSASGNGLAVFVQIEKDKHEEAFLGLQKYFEEEYHIIADVGCRDICRLRFASYDPDAAIGMGKSVFNKYLKIENKKNYVYIPCTKTDVSKIVRQVNEKKLCIVNSYEEAMRLCASLASLGESGREFLHVCCQNMSRWPYSPEKTDKKFNNFLATANGEISIGTFYHYAQRAGCNTNKEKGLAISKICKDSKRLGKGSDDAVKRLITKNVICLGDDKENAEDKELVERIYQEAETGQIEGIQEIESYVLENFPCRLNLLTDTLELTLPNGSIELVDDAMIGNIYLDTKKVIESTRKNDVYDMLRGRSPRYNPIEEFIDKHRQEYIAGGKCKGAIEALSNTLISVASISSDSYDGSYEYLFISKWLVGMIATMRGEVSPILLALTGTQNSGKTEWFRRLLPKELKPYYTEQQLSTDKDALLLMASKLLILDDELSSKNKIEERHLKELLSKKTYSVRPAYGRVAKTYTRMATFCGTSNVDTVITDPTGNRRIVPIIVYGIEKEAYNAIDKIAVFMEAVKLYEEKYSFALDANDIAYLNEHTVPSRGTSFERELLEEHSYSPLRGELPAHTEYLTAAGVLAKLKELSGVSDTKINHAKLGIELRSMGYKRVSKRLPGGQSPAYCYEICFRVKTDIWRNS